MAGARAQAASAEEGGYPGSPPRDRTGLTVAGLVALAVLAYANSFGGAFVFDDAPSIVDNPSIHDWTAWGQMLSPPHYLTTSGRPIVNASLALSWAMGGANPWAYHALNLVIHALAVLVLLGVMRRTLRLPALRERFGAHAGGLAFAIAAVWAVHPLQTEAVTYIVQRAESLMGLFYLLTLYCCIRSLDAARPGRWWAGAMAACALGMGTKEVMVSAPLFALLFDRTLVSGNFQAAWQKRGILYSGLAATWVILALLVLGEGGNRGGSIGTDAGMGWWEHGLTQFTAVVKYLSLSLWPAPLTFEYGPDPVTQVLAIAPQACLVAALLAVTLFGLWRRSAVALAGSWAFAVLAPTSLMPAPQLIAEHRMYLTLVPLIALAVLGLYAWTGRRGVWLYVTAALPFALLTAHRNMDYRSEIAIWADTVAKRPLNPTAQGSLGNALGNAGRLDAGFAHLQEAIRLDPKSALLRYSLGLVLGKMGRRDEALAAYQEAIRLRPDYADAYMNYGVACAQAGRKDDALHAFTEALRLRPQDAGAHYNLGALLLELGHPQESAAHFATALRLRPVYPEALVAWGNALAYQGDVEGALAHYNEALAQRPGDLRACNRAGQLLLAVGRAREAVKYFQLALQLQPDDQPTRANLAAAQSQLGGE